MKIEVAGYAVTETEFERVHEQLREEVGEDVLEGFDVRSYVRSPAGRRMVIEIRKELLEQEVANREARAG